MAPSNRIDELVLQFTDDIHLTKDQRQSIVVPIHMDSLEADKYKFEKLPYPEGELNKTI
jgi:hypothetical protein